MNIYIDHIKPETGSDLEKWTVTVYDNKKTYIYHNEVSESVYDAINHLQSQLKEREEEIEKLKKQLDSRKIAIIGGIKHVIKH
jgi:hypothetical protein